MIHLFYGCSSLEVINMTQFNGENVDNAELFLKGVSNLKMLILYCSQLNDNILEELKDAIGKIENLAVCQDETQIIEGVDGCDIQPGTGSPDNQSSSKPIKKTYVKPPDFPYTTSPYIFFILINFIYIYNIYNYLIFF